MTASVVLATCAEHPGLDEEGLLLQAALQARGIRSDAVPWTDDTYPWQTAFAVLPRATWDYYRHLSRFAAWASGLGARLVNPPVMVAWNATKQYLADLADDGVPVVATRFIRPGQAYDIPVARASSSLPWRQGRTAPPTTVMWPPPARTSGRCMPPDARPWFNPT